MKPNLVSFRGTIVNVDEVRAIDRDMRRCITIANAQGMTPDGTAILAILYRNLPASEATILRGYAALEAIAYFEAAATPSATAAVVAGADPADPPLSMADEELLIQLGAAAPHGVLTDKIIRDGDEASLYTLVESGLAGTRLEGGSSTDHVASFGASRYEFARITDKGLAYLAKYHSDDPADPPLSSYDENLLIKLNRETTGIPTDLIIRDGDEPSLETLKAFGLAEVIPGKLHDDGTAREYFPDVAKITAAGVTYLGSSEALDRHAYGCPYDRAELATLSKLDAAAADSLPLHIFDQSAIARLLKAGQVGIVPTPSDVNEPSTLSVVMTDAGYDRLGKK